jgi:hypothetical protein
MTTPAVNATSTTKTMGALHWWPKKKRTVASPWLFKANAKRVKKMATLSVHLKSHAMLFIGFLVVEVILIGRV